METGDVYNAKSMGPRTDPCGTPVEFNVTGELVPPTDT